MSTRPAYIWLSCAPMMPVRIAYSVSPTRSRRPSFRKALFTAGILRVTTEGELEGLDIDQHGISAYPDENVTAWVPAQGRAVG